MTGESHRLCSCPCWDISWACRPGTGSCGPCLWCRLHCQPDSDRSVSAWRISWRSRSSHYRPGCRNVCPSWCLRTHNRSAQLLRSEQEKDDGRCGPLPHLSLLTFSPRSKWSISEVGVKGERPGWAPWPMWGGGEPLLPNIPMGRIPPILPSASEQEQAFKLFWLCTELSCHQPPPPLLY